MGGDVGAVELGRCDTSVPPHMLTEKVALMHRIASVPPIADFFLAYTTPSSLPISLQLSYPRMTLAISGLGESYSLTELPRIPDLSLPERVVVSESQNAKLYLSTETIDVGISKLIISSYILKPTPKLCWSYPLSPSTVVDSMDVKDSLYLVALTERKKSKLLLIQRTNDESVITAEIKLSARAVGVKFSSSNNAYVLLTTGSLEFYSLDLGETLAIEKVPELPSLTEMGTKSGKVVFHKFISDHNLQHKQDLFFYICKSGNTKLTYRLIALDGAKTFEIFLTSISIPKSENLLFAYNDGVVYKFDQKSKIISSSSLMKPQEIIKSFSLENIIGTTTSKSLFSLHSPSPERLLLSHNSLVFVINFKFESLLGEHTNNSHNQVYVSFTLPVAGDSAETRNSFALYLNFEAKTKTCKLKLIQVDMGLNLLSESLGKSVHPATTDSQWNGFPVIESDDLEAANAEIVKTLEKVYKALVKDKSEKNTSAFNKHVIEFLKGSPVEKKKSYKFSPLTDRVVDAKFIESILEMIFEIDEVKSVQIIDEGFLPVTTLSYLLTHPLYPASFGKGLLILLSKLNQPELLRQAIDFCVGLSIEELTGELINLVELTDEMDLEEMDEAQLIVSFLKATIDRLIKEYSVGLITSKLQQLLNLEYETANKKLDRMLNVLININSNQSWTLLQAVIDVGGLFNWSLPTINKLSAVIDSKVEALAQNSYNLTLTSQAVLGLQNAGKKGAKKSVPPKVVDNIHEINNQRLQLDAILTISNNTTNKKLIEDDGIELAKKIPTYSREKLIL